MDIIINDNFLANSDKRESSLKEFLQVYKFFKENKEKNIHFYKRNDIDWSFLQTDKDIIRKLGYAFNIFSIIKSISYDEERVSDYTEIASEFDEILARVVQCCVENEIEHIYSVKQLNENIPENFEIKEKLLWNVCDIKEILERYARFPQIQSISDAFNRIHQEFPYIIFLNKAYQTCDEKENVYRQFGYEKVVQLFEIANDILFPVLLNKIRMPEKECFRKYEEKTKIDVSRETPATMKQFGYEREVEIDGEKIQMEIHFKIKDARIYIHAKNDKIYVGHCGRHLRTKTGY